MKKKFSTAWKASKQPRKQRKYRANAPLHIKKKFVNVNLSKELRKKYGKRNIGIRKGDVVKVMTGKFKKKQGKVLEVKLKMSKIIVDGMNIKKMDGSNANVKMQPSNLQIVELNLEDKKRIKKLGIKKTETKKEEKIKQDDKKMEKKK
ncbi:MAG: 50S ribosomal protein L24 [Nanoarchaeota archaeon]|nr:50S ribosomal protein L24 [Nanoarchaeota archaeon]